MENKKPVDIVIATYNGEKYIREQVESIVACINFDALVSQIIIADDNSKDKTLILIKELQRKYPMIVVLCQAEAQLGPRLNFNRGLAATTAPYIMMADQDDFWCENKLVFSYESILAIEESNTVMLPALVFTDVSIVDAELKEISASNNEYVAEPLSWSAKVSQLMVENVALGCTMMVNRKLLDIALPIPLKSSMHDWWLILVAKIFGKISYVSEPTMLYRQHSNNVIGIGNSHKAKNPITRQYDRLKNYTEKLMGCSEQMNTLCERYPEISEHLNKSEYASVYQFANIVDMSLFKRASFLLNSRVKPSTNKRTIMFIVCVLLLPLLK